MAKSDPFDRRDPPVFATTLWAHRSLSLTGAQQVMLLTTVGLAIPLIPFLGTPVAWGMLPFLVGVLVALFLAIRASWRSGELHEVLKLWPDLITVEQVDSLGRTQRWHANPHWVDLRLHDNARLESYLTLRGNGREIELGAFLSPEERVDLHDRLTGALRQARHV